MGQGSGEAGRHGEEVGHPPGSAVAAEAGPKEVLVKVNDGRDVVGGESVHNGAHHGEIGRVDRPRLGADALPHDAQPDEGDAARREAGNDAPPEELPGVEGRRLGHGIHAPVEAAPAAGVHEGGSPVGPQVDGANTAGECWRGRGRGCGDHGQGDCHKRRDDVHSGTAEARHPWEWRRAF